MTIHLTTAQARRAGIDVPSDTKVRVRKTARGPYHTVCKTCGVEFHTIAAEDQHVVDTLHVRYQLITTEVQ